MEHTGICGHLWHKYYVTFNQVMVVTVITSLETKPFNQVMTTTVIASLETKEMSCTTSGVLQQLSLITDEVLVWNNITSFITI